METQQRIYFIGLTSLILSASLLIFWLLSPSILLTWIGLGLSLVGLLGAAYALRLAFYFFKNSQIKQNKRIKYLALLMFVLSFALCFNFMNARTFGKVAFSPKQIQYLNIRIKNTSLDKVESVQIEFGSQSHKIEHLESNHQRTIRFLNPTGGELIARVSSPKSNKETKLAISGYDKNLLLRIDPQHNILPDLN